MDNIFNYKHLIGLILVSCFVAISLLIMLKIKDKKKVLKFSSIILILLELLKYLYIYLGDGSISKIYIPLQFCSLFLYTFPIIAFGKGQLSEFLKPVSYAGGIIAVTIAFILPTNIIGDPNISWFDKENFLYTLSFIYHGWVLSISIYIRLSGFYKPVPKDLFKAIITIFVFTTIAILANIILDTDFMMMNRGAGNPFQFILINNGFMRYFFIHLILMFILLSPFFIRKKHN